ncbi:MAG TPA: NAD(P)H-quinone oxidoreductase [Terriglobales bacterium]|nr:NAD(P)H-quinone oxidoreductase [Terriglobales bacterium]
MKAIVIARPGGPEVLELRDVPQPAPGPDEVLVRVHAAGVNRADLLQRAGRYPAPPGVPADIPGMEFSGEVADTGARVKRWRKGDRVMGLVGGGAYAEFVVAHEGVVAAVPDSLSWTEAAAIPEAFITAHDALWSQAELQPGERVLIHAVASGVGLAAVQLARARNAEPFGTSRTPDKIERARAFGLVDGIALGGDFSALGEATRRWTSGRGFNAVLDLVGGPYVAASVDALASRGRLMLVGTVAGTHADIDLGKVLGKRLHLIGTVLRGRSLEEKVAAAASFEREALPDFVAGTLRPILDAEFPLERASEAHAYIESNQSFGKAVIVVA